VALETERKPDRTFCWPFHTEVICAFAVATFASFPLYSFLFSAFDKSNALLMSTMRRRH